MKKIQIAMLASAVALLSSCSLTMPVNATSNTVGNKVGRSKATIDRY